MFLSKKSTTINAIVYSAAAVLFLMAPVLSRASTSFNAATDFSPTNNPNGAWSYGWSPTLGSTFNLYSRNWNYLNVDGWTYPTNSGALTPQVIHNGTPNAVNIQDLFGTLILKPGQLAFYPSALGEFSVVRLTAPATGDYSLTADFSGVNFGFVGMNTDVHVLHNGISLFDGAVIGGGSITSLSTRLISVLTGDTIDFIVGWGSDSNYIADSTGLAATISSVPIPGAVSLFAGGLLALFRVGKTRTKLTR